MTFNKGWIDHREIFLLAVLIALGILIRIIKIDQPFIDAWSWRQSDVAMIAENFYRNGYNIFYPQINWAGTDPGYIGSEFQLLPIIASFLYIFWGVQDWVGRSLSVLSFAFSMPFFYLLVKKTFNERGALIATIIYLFIPLGIFASRSFMHDMASLSFSLASLFLFSELLEDPNNKKLFISATVTTSLAILVKLPSIIIGLPLLYMAWVKYGAKLFIKRNLWVFAILTLSLPLVWYLHAYLINTLFSPYHFTGEGGIKIMDYGWYKSIFYKTMTSSLTPIVFIGMLIGLFLRSDGKFIRLFHWWLLSIILFVIIVGLGNRHEWYRLHLVPVAAAFSGLTFDFGIEKLSKLSRSKILVFTATIIVFLIYIYLAYTYVKPYYRSWATPAFKAGIEINRIAPNGALVIIANGGDPTGIYYSKRKGWHFPQARIISGEIFPVTGQQAIREIETRRKEGADYLIFSKYTRWWLDYYKDFQKHLDSQYRRIRETDEFIIFDLKIAGHK